MKMNREIVLVSIRCRLPNGDPQVQSSARFSPASPGNRHASHWTKVSYLNVYGKIGR